jgi:nicotinate-nucleotide pyrophosphorylase (carboxylating)
MREAVRLRPPGLLLEASGGIQLKTIRRVAETGVDFISVGALTHSAGSVDLSMELVPHD